MRSYFVVTLAALFMVFQQPAAAQDDLKPSSQLLLDELGDELAEKSDAYDRYRAYWDRDVTLADIAADDPLLAMLAPILRLEVGAGVAEEFGVNAIETLAYDEPENLEWAIDDLLASAYYNSSASPPTRKDLYKLGGALDRLNAAGMSVSQIRDAAPPLIGELLDKAIKLYKAGLSADELANADEPERDRIIRDFLSLAPTSLNPQLGGPAGAAFADALDWNGRMWDATTDGLDLVADAIETGHVDMERHAAIAARIEALAAKGPWDGDTATTFFKQWATGLPGIGKFLKAVWPEPLPELCKPINCDCDHVMMELFGEFRKACLATEAELISRCAEKKAISGSCHPTAQGPDAFPPG
jgi:hypothetical protein